MSAFLLCIGGCPSHFSFFAHIKQSQGFMYKKKGNSQKSLLSRFLMMLLWPTGRLELQRRTLKSSHLSIDKSSVLCTWGKIGLNSCKIGIVISLFHTLPFKNEMNYIPSFFTRITKNYIFLVDF